MFKLYFLSFLLLSASPSFAGVNKIFGGEDGLNQELQTTWNILVPQYRETLIKEIHKAINKAIADQDRDNEFQIKEAYTPDIHFGPYPGLTSLDKQSVGIRLPLNGSWGLDQKLKLRIKYKTPLGSIQDTSVYKVKVRKLSINLTASFETKGQYLAIKEIKTPNVNLDVEVTCNHTILNGVLSLLQDKVNELAKAYIKEAIAKEKHKLMEFAMNSRTIPGLGAGPLQDSGTPVDLETIAFNIDKKIVEQHSPWGLIFESEMDAASETSWEEAFGANGSGNEGNVVNYKGWVDSAIWTGHYLASQVFRYETTKDQEAFQNILRTLEGIGLLLDVNGKTGLLARAVFPIEHPIAQEIIAEGTAFRRKEIDGQVWVSYQGKRGVSRDQYAGAFFGLATAYDLIKDPAIKSMSADRMEQMLDYLIAKNWMITEDRIGPERGGDGFPTFWTGINYQKLTFLVIGNHINPAKYGPHLAAASELAESAWFPVWTGLMEPLDGYYGHNLNYISLYSYFRFEKDEKRKAFMRDAFHLTNNHIGHHVNAHFDMIKIATEPETYRDLYAPSVREALRQFVRRNHRMVTPKDVDYSNIEYEETPMYGKLPKKPLSIEQRYYADFLWQKNPFRVEMYNDVMMETPGLDLTLPYWMGRYFKVF